MISVNLTTTKQRMRLCRIALTSLLMQSRSPDRINLWISREPYLRDDGFEDRSLVNELLKSLPPFDLTKLKVHWVENTGPYRKLLPVLRSANDMDIIVTADDDIFYGEKWLETLLKDFNPARKVVVAARVRYQKRNVFGILQGYSYWPLIRQEMVISKDYLVTFGGGVVMTKSMFLNDDIYDDSFTKLSPTADDLWFTKLVKRGGASVLVKPEVLFELDFLYHNDGLDNLNFFKRKKALLKLFFGVVSYVLGYLGFPATGNDKAFKRIEGYFHKR